MPAKIGQAMYLRQQALPVEVRDIAWKAQVRLCARYRRMLARRKKAPVVITAIARRVARNREQAKALRLRIAYLHHAVGQVPAGRGRSVAIGDICYFVAGVLAEQR
jgi:hypothetical protein